MSVYALTQSLVINPTHPYLRACGAEVVSVVSNNVAAVDLMRNRRASIVGGGNLFRVAIQTMGNALLCNASGGGQGITFAGRTAMANVDCTLVCVAQLSDTGTSRRLIGTSSTTNAGYLIEAQNGNTWRFTLGNVVQSTFGMSLSQDTPYFIAATYRASDGNTLIVSRNLKTRALVEASGTATGPAVDGDGSFNLGGASVFSANMWFGYASMGVWGFRYCPQSVLEEWSLHPYAFVRSSSRAVAAPAPCQTSVTLTAAYSFVQG